jgi:hypothetical protein
MQGVEAVAGAGLDGNVQAASALFEEVVDWLREHYGQFEFWVERDVVWTVQTRLRKLVTERSLPFEVFNDYPLLSGPRRARSADLVIRDTAGVVLVAAEFKYEPSHRRAEFAALPGKLPMVFWGNDGVAKDVIRIREFVEAGAAATAFAMFLDEGRHFRHRAPHLGTAWYDWRPAQPGDSAPSVLWARWPPGDLQRLCQHQFGKTRATVRPNRSIRVQQPNSDQENSYPLLWAATWPVGTAVACRTEL